VAAWLAAVVPALPARWSVRPTRWRSGTLPQAAHPAGEEAAQLPRPCAVRCRPHCV